MQSELQLLKTSATLHAALAGIVDYAGMFPPAGLSLPEAVRNYSQYRATADTWMLGRFVVPARRLGELDELLAQRPFESEWKISALVGDKADLDAINKFNREADGRAVVDTVELKPELRSSLREFVNALPEGITVYQECHLQVSTEELQLLKAVDARPKVRTGGLVADAIPSAHDLAAFVASAARAGTPFKATAGLHHPIRCSKPLTYEPGSASGTMHGFVSLLVTCAVALRDDAPSADLLSQILSDGDTTSFEFTDSGARWKEIDISPRQFLDARSRMLVSFGSCSFEEPINDLSELGWLR